MKKALITFGFALACLSSLGQGTLIFKTIGIQTSTGSGTYNVPLFANDGNNVQNGFPMGDVPPEPGLPGAGTVPGGVTVGLFAPGASTPFATGILGTTAQTSPFVVTPAAQTVAVPGSPPGSTPTIIIRAWQGPSFDNTFPLQWGEWALTTKPLGGDPGGGALPITPPTLTGWGNENGAGFELNMPTPEPSTIALGVVGIGALVLARRRKYAVA
jgi:hypothetical protein